MHRAVFQFVSAALLAALASGASADSPYVEFDFARAVECRDVTPIERFEQYPQQRLVELILPVSVRFRGVELDDVEELTIEISGAAAGLRVLAFAPATQLTSDVTHGIETTTTTKSARSIDATLGGNLPVPAAELVAHVTPSITAGASSGETTTEKLNRLPPKHAIVVSGTQLEGRGVFYKLKRFSQTSLEGVHDFAVTFIAPAGWRGGEIHVACNALGRRKVLWINQPATWGHKIDVVRVYVAGRGVTRKVAKPVLVENTPSATEPTVTTLASKADSPAHADVPEHKSSATKKKKTAWTAKREALIDDSP